MAILVREDVPGMTADEFDRLFAPLLDRVAFFPGFVANASGPTPGGYQVTEVWDSQEAHERWLREVIAPTMRRAGLLPEGGQMPAPEYLPLDRFITR